MWDIINGALNFMNLFEIPSYPHVFFDLKDFIICFYFINSGIMPIHFCKGFMKLLDRQFIGFAIFTCLLLFVLIESAID